MERFPLKVRFAEGAIVAAICAVGVPFYLYVFEHESVAICLMSVVVIVAVAVGLMFRSLGLLGKGIELSADGLSLPRAFRSAEEIPWMTIAEIREERVQPTRQAVPMNQRERVLRIQHELGIATISELQIGLAEFDELCKATRTHRADAYRKLEMMAFGSPPA